MALTIDSSEADELSRLLNDPRYDARHDIWLWLWLNQYHDAHFDSVTCNGITMRETLASYLSERSGILESVNSEKDQFLVPDSCLRWIDGNERQSQWLLRQIEPVTDQGPAEGFPRGLVRLTGKNRLIAMLDLWKLDVAEKVIAIGHMRADWLEHEARDRDFEWFKDRKETNERCKCAWEWLEKMISPYSKDGPLSAATTICSYTSIKQGTVPRNENTSFRRSRTDGVASSSTSVRRTKSSSTSCSPKKSSIYWMS